MAKEILLDSDIEAGRKLLQAIDADGEIKITAAMWFFYPDLEKWKLLLYSSDIESKKDEDIKLTWLYTKISMIISKLDSQVAASLSSVKLVVREASLLKLFKAIIRVEGISAIRMTSNYINGVYIEDALIYRNI